MLETEPVLIKEYVATGKAKIIYRHLLQLGERTERASEASECAAEQNMFWDMRYALYDRQNDIYNADLVDTLFGDMAQELGMNRATFDTCMQQNTHREEVRADDAASRKLGITGRPVFLIGETRLVGAQPFEAFEAVLGK